MRKFLRRLRVAGNRQQRNVAALARGMVMRRYLRFMSVSLVALVGLSSPAFASTENTNVSTISPTLAVSATVQKAIRLTLSQGASGTACTVTTASDFSMTFGTVDALGI